MTTLRRSSLGVNVTIAGEGSPAKALRQVFDGFAPPRAGGDTLEVRLEPLERGARVTIFDGDRTVRRDCDTELKAFGYGYAQLIERILDRATRFLGFHAASLASGGRGLIVAGESGHGKSTLALALRDRGFDLYSDEVAPVEKGTSRLHPFPMAVGCRPGAFSALAGVGAVEGGFEPAPFMQKMLVPESSRPGSLDPVDLAAVVFLESRNGETEEVRSWGLCLERPVPGLARELEGVSGVENVVEVHGGSVYRIEVAGGRWVAPEVDAVFAASGAVVSTVRPPAAARPEFSLEPTIAEISPHEGALGLLRHLRRFGILERHAAETENGFGGLVIELLDALEPVRFYRMTPGRLESAVELLCATMVPTR